ncbi:MAG: sulfur carrier protein ThiS [Paludibacter sp.]|nr:sulfur carrier protein ThiS [Paludibacter sp.]
MSKISVNGKPQELDTPLSIAELIKINNVLQPAMVTIQLNSQFVNRDEYDSKQVVNGDEVDFLYFMGGGSNSYQLSVFNLQ